MEPFKDAQTKKAQFARNSTYTTEIGSGDLFLPAHFILVLT